MSASFNYIISYGGGIGPDVWDAELELSAVDIQDAIAQANGRIEESGGWIFMVSQEDYPLTTREKLEKDLTAARAERDAAVAERDGAAEKLQSIEACIPIGFYYDESLPSRVRIMRKHWDKLGKTMEENAALRMALERVKRGLCYPDEYREVATAALNQKY